MNIKQQRVRSVRTSGPGGLTAIEHRVACPESGHSIDFGKCCACPRRESIRGSDDGSATIACRTTATMKRGRVDVAEAAIRVQLLEIAGERTTCLRPELTRHAARALFAEEGLRAAPVVDADGHLVGVLSLTDLEGAEEEAMVGDAMSKLAHALPEEAPVAYAISLMARDRIHEVPLVDSAGRVVGMVDAIGALRWVAEALGYVMSDSGKDA